MMMRFWGSDKHEVESVARSSLSLVSDVRDVRAVDRRLVGS